MLKLTLARKRHITSARIYLARASQVDVPDLSVVGGTARI